jgi:SH3-like domain-containing protein
VPRYVTLKYDTVNARGGPGDDYRLLWVYHAKALPLLVIEETIDWRRVRDPDGDFAWLHRRTLIDKQISVMRVAKSPLPLRAYPKPNAAVIAELAPHAVAALKECKDGWCKVRAGAVEGYAPRDGLWGADTPRAVAGCGKDRR